MKKKSIELSQEQRNQLEEVITKGTAPVRKIKHAQILLKIDSGKEGSHFVSVVCVELSQFFFTLRAVCYYLVLY